MDQAGSDYVLAGRVLHAGSIVLTHAVAPEAQTALTLREVCGLTTEDIARAFLVSPPTLAQRIVRAKAKIRDARIPYRMPPTEELPHRLEDVLRVAYLVFNEGITPPRATR
jgi:RNA polymerase sigma-70 factor, ECF subfamily